MANSLVVRKDTSLAKRNRSLRAAQYVRMSTDYQRYSIDNQVATIADYAQSHDLSIVRTYRDEGKSGLTLKNRPGLIKLLDDVISHHVDFEFILIYDISRWGRFQDIDEHAHYEFICRQAGMKVAYCAEPFENDGSVISGIAKHIKRVMAAEKSRELSVKVHAGACRFSSMGFKLGGRAIYALQRVLVDEKLQEKGVLKNGDRKYLQTDHVRLRPGPPSEVAVVKWMFHRFLELKSEKAIAVELNEQGIPSSTGGRWTGHLLTRVLKNENYIGNIIYNRKSWKLGGKLVHNPRAAWVRSEGCIEPIIKLDVFRAVNKIIEERRVDLTEDEMLVRLRRTLFKRGRLSPKIIEKTVGLPCPHVYIAHFGSLRNAYRLIGYTSQRNCDYIDSRRDWAVKLAELASQLSTNLEKLGGRVVSIGKNGNWHVDGTANIFLRIARWIPGEKDHYSARWSMQRRGLVAGWIVAIRLGDNNTSILDYLLVPAACTDRDAIRFSEKDRARLGMTRFETSEALVRSLSLRLTKQGRVSQPKQARPSTHSRPSPPKKVEGHPARH
jgi:DNA invertase Pin-like site-specific DNA recombinase